MSISNKIFTSNFLSNENVTILWEIVKEYIGDNSNDYDHTLNIFKENLSPFYENERNRMTLIDMNKKYILMIIQYIKNSRIPETKSTLIKKESSGSVKPVTVEEIQNSRLHTFERDLNYRQEEFTNSMSIQKPPVPIFSIKIEDEPIIEMEETIKKMIVQRNYDIDIINKNIESQNISPETWLKPSETSIKNKENKEHMETSKEPNKETNKETKENKENIKFIKIDETNLDSKIYKNQIIDLNKHITWEDETDIFTKFKKIKSDQDNIDLNRILVIEENVLNLSNKIKNIDENIMMILEKMNKYN